jgi:hypothetical protein
MPSAGAEELLERLEMAWRPLREVAEAAGPAVLEQATSAGWSGKEMIAHVAFWEEAVEGFVTLVLRQRVLSEGWEFGSGYRPEEEWPAADVHNAREAAWARHRPSAEVLARWDAAHARLVRFLGTVSDEEAEAHADYFTESVEGHFGDHRAEFEELRAASE